MMPGEKECMVLKARESLETFFPEAMKTDGNFRHLLTKPFSYFLFQIPAPSLAGAASAM